MATFVSAGISYVKVLIWKTQVIIFYGLNSILKSKIKLTVVVTFVPGWGKISLDTLRNSGGNSLVSTSTISVAYGAPERFLSVVLE